MKRSADINQILRPLAEAPNQAYLSNAVQVADVLEWILRQVGPAEIWQTSFSVSEEFLRRLHAIGKSHDLRRFHMVLDRKATNKTVKLWLFINSVVADTYLADNHSKILLVKADDGRRVAVITSQNLTRGNREESAFISTERAIFDGLHASVTDLIRNRSVPVADQINGRLGAEIPDIEL